MSEPSQLMHADMDACAKDLVELRRSAGRGALLIQRYEQALRMVAFRCDTLEQARASARLALHPKVRE